MRRRPPTVEELLNDLDAYGAHADELAKPLPRELEPLDELRGSVETFERPSSPVTDPEDWDV